MTVFKNKFTRLVAVVMAVVMTTAMAGCTENPQHTDAPETLTEYVVLVANKGGTALDKCSVEVFSDSTKTNMIYKGITNKEGRVSFTASSNDDYVAVVSRVPDGYSVQEHYELTGESTTIVLAPGVMTDEDFESVVYSLGDAVLDFTVTGPDGTKYVLSQLLKEKKAVVLNFWFLSCGPCQMEFPYLQEAYQQLGDEIEVLALNPYDGDDAKVSAFKTDNGYTFPMLKCDDRWAKMMDLSSYPTTVVIDRFGNICLIHGGMVTDTQTFLDMFGYFVSDDYEQIFAKSHSQLPAYNAQ